MQSELDKMENPTLPPPAAESQGEVIITLTGPANQTSTLACAALMQSELNSSENPNLPPAAQSQEKQLTGPANGYEETPKEDVTEGKLGAV